MDYAHAGGDEFGGGSVPPAGWPKPVGILSIVFGSLALTCTILGAGAGVLGESLMGGMMGGALPPGVPPPPFTPPLDAIFIASIAVGVIVNILLIVAGVRLIGRSRTGRTLHLVYALAAVLASFFGGYAGYHSQQAQTQAMNTWVADHGEKSDETRAIAQSWDQQSAMQGPVQSISLLVGVAFGLAWPVFCIVWFGIVKKDVPPAVEY